MFIYFSLTEEQELFELFLFASVMGEWGVYDYPKTGHLPSMSAGGGVWVSNGLLVWSIFDLGGGGGMQYNHLVFQA